jgi:methionyl-tRNA formyltransferase
MRIEVDRLNHPDAVARVRALAPKAVFVASTGMLRTLLLQACACPVVNYHSGVSPAYRGINGGYFALANGEKDNFGVTLHLVDLGVDTGTILAVNRINVTAADNLQTYMTLMAARSQPLVVATMARVLAGDLTPLSPRDLPSRMLGQYLSTGLKRGVW